MRFFEPEEPGLFYLPYKFDAKQWSEFPQEIAEYQIRTADGPKSQKDGRSWATGRIEYTPPDEIRSDITVSDMPSPYVLIDARFTLNVELSGAESSIKMETSTDGGHSWLTAGEKHGPFKDAWKTEPAVLAKSEHGRLTAVSGHYEGLRCGARFLSVRGGLVPDKLTAEPGIRAKTHYLAQPPFPGPPARMDLFKSSGTAMTRFNGLTGRRSAVHSVGRRCSGRCCNFLRVRSACTSRCKVPGRPSTTFDWRRTPKGLHRTDI
jgi:hypothetical protein